MKNKIVSMATSDSTRIIITTQGNSVGIPFYREYYGTAQIEMGDEYHHLYEINNEEFQQGD